MITIGGSANFFSTDTNGFTSSAIVTSGDFIGVYYAGGANSGSYALSDSKANTWLTGTKTTAFFGLRASQWFWAFNAIVGTGHTFTITGSGSAPTLMVLWFSGVKILADPFDSQAAGGGSNGATTIQAGNFTPTENNCLILHGNYRDSNGGGSPTIDGGFTRETWTTNTDFGHFYGAAAYLIQTTATAVNPTWTLPASDITIASGIAFKAATAISSDSDIKNRMIRRPAPFKPMGDAFRPGKFSVFRKYHDLYAPDCFVKKAA